MYNCVRVYACTPVRLLNVKIYRFAARSVKRMEHQTIGTRARVMRILNISSR